MATRMNLPAQRQAIQALLGAHNPADAHAAYYALYHPDNRTQLVTYPAGVSPATGYLCLSRTGIDLFRPLATLRLPANDPAGTFDLLYTALMPGQSLFLHIPQAYYPLLNAFFDFQTVQNLALYRLDSQQFEPIINVLVSRNDSPDKLPRFIIRDNNGQIGASAGVNWLSPHFADISVHTQPQHRQRGWGRSVVSALVHYLRDSGRIPLYAVHEQNEPSRNLAESLSFTDTGHRQLFLEATLRERSQ